jgi:hypothetical protein
MEIKAQFELLMTHLDQVNTHSPGCQFYLEYVWKPNHCLFTSKEKGFYFMPETSRYDTDEGDYLGPAVIGEDTQYTIWNAEDLVQAKVRDLEYVLDLLNAKLIKLHEENPEMYEYSLEYRDYSDYEGWDLTAEDPTITEKNGFYLSADVARYWGDEGDFVGKTFEEAEEYIDNFVAQYK